MFPKAKRALTDEVLDRIGTEIERAHATRVSVAPASAERTLARRRMTEGSGRRRASAAIY
ncbi:MAG: hypothetical protein QM820_31520 [Minicystis sp.]